MGQEIDERLPDCLVSYSFVDPVRAFQSKRNDQNAVQLANDAVECGEKVLLREFAIKSVLRPDEVLDDPEVDRVIGPMLEDRDALAEEQQSSQR